MRKTEFLAELSSRLGGLPREDAERSLSFYEEMIDDRVEEGADEENAVAALGSVDEIVRQIAAETPIGKLVKERVKGRRRLHGWEIVLLALGAPLWIPLAVAAACLVLVFFLLLWIAVIVIGVAAAAVFIAGIALCAGSVAYFISGEALTGVACIGAGIACVGLALLLVPALICAAKGTAKLCRAIVLGIKTVFVGKGRAK